MSLLGKIAGFVPESERTFISITGGGGKSSLMKALAAWYKNAGKQVLITTSTKIQSPVFFDWGTDAGFFEYGEIEKHRPEGPESILFGCKIQDDIHHLKGPAEYELRALKNRFDVVICEADGSRHLPLKYHTPRDPVIYGFSDFTIAVMGAWAYGSEAWEVTFGYDGDSKVDVPFLNAYIESADGLLKGNPDMVLVNGIDDGLDYKPFETLHWPAGLKVIGGSLRDDAEVFEL